MGRELVGEEDTEYSPFNEILSTYIQHFYLLLLSLATSLQGKLGNVVFHLTSVPSSSGFFY